MPQAVAMTISGYRAVSMFMRYNIASEDDKRDALRWMQAHVAAQPVERNLSTMTQEGGSEAALAQFPHRQSSRSS
ncbi:MAG TPA: hypothetical protein VJV23_04145 [Candidatus Polarisedimenticolia bacterium]|nr:hypothetical protein [Candidatus Polarisedimenticolia bacterium]